MAIIGHGGEPKFLKDSAFVGQAIGKVDIAQSVVGRARQAFEYAAGSNPFPGEQFATVKNQQKLYGHDHSGPPWGSAFLHPVAWWSWQKPNAKLIAPVMHPFGAIVDDTRGDGFCFWNRPHAPLPAALGVAPYSKLRLYILAHKKGANKDLVVNIFRTGPAGVDAGSAQSATLTLTSTTPTGFVTDAFLECHGGRNGFYLTATTTATSSADALTIDGIALCNVEKRFHEP